MRKGESIFKRKDGRYEARYVKDYKDGRAVYGYVYADSYNKVKARRTEVLSRIPSRIIKPRRVKNDLNYLIDNWLNSKTNLKESSYTKYYNLINEHIRNDIGKVKVPRLSSELVNNYIIRKLESGKLNRKGGLSKNTVYDICNILKQVFKANKKDINMVKIMKVVGVGKSIYSNEKIDLERILSKDDSLIAIGVQLSLLLGVRESEVCGIRFADIDIKNNPRLVIKNR